MVASSSTTRILALVLMASPPFPDRSLVRRPKHRVSRNTTLPVKLLAPPSPADGPHAEQPAPSDDHGRDQVAERMGRGAPASGACQRCRALARSRRTRGAVTGT